MTSVAVDDLVRFIAAVVTFAVVGVGIGMLAARRLDRWAAASNDDPPDPSETMEEPEEPGDDDRPDA